MRGCHNCEHAAAIAEGKYAGRAWEDVPCAGCDAIRETGRSLEFEEWRKTAAAVDMGDGMADEELLPVSVMQEVMVGFLSLSPELRDVVAWRYAGMKYDDIAKVQGVTMACAEKRHRRAMELWPTLRALFPEKSAKQERRRTGVAAND